MLHVLTPLEETRAYRELVGIGIEKGKQEGLKEGKEEGEKLGRRKEALTILTKQLRRRFGALPRWASARLRQADAEQLEAWAERIFDANDLTDLLGPRADCSPPISFQYRRPHSSEGSINCLICRCRKSAETH